LSIATISYQQMETGVIKATHFSGPAAS